MPSSLPRVQISTERADSLDQKVTSNKHSNPAARAARSSDEHAKRVLCELEEAMHGRANMNDPMMEQLKQCPEVFKVGEILGKAFDSVKYAQDGSELGDRYLPPSGVVIPPLV